MFTSQVSRKLHEEHCATLAVMEQLEALIARRNDASARNRDSLDSVHLRGAASFIESELVRHFDFEEESLFGRLEADGEGSICAYLIDEHRVLRPLGMRLAALARGAASGELSETDEEELRRTALQFCDGLRAHVQKEELALLPALEDALDEQTDARLHDAYVMNQ